MNQLRPRNDGAGVGRDSTVGRICLGTPEQLEDFDDWNLACGGSAGAGSPRSVFGMGKFRRPDGVQSFFKLIGPYQDIPSICLFFRNF